MDANQPNFRALVTRGESETAWNVEALFRRYQGDLLRHLTGRFGPHLAEDAVAAVFLKLLRGQVPDLDRDPWPWLRRVGTNAAIDNLRVHRRETTLPVDIDLGASEFTEGILTKIDVDAALDELSELELDAVTAGAMGRASADVGLRHGRSVEAVRSVAKRARKRLRILLDPAMLPVIGLLAWLRRRAARLNGSQAQAVSEVVAAGLVIVAVAAAGALAPAGPQAAVDVTTPRLIASEHVALRSPRRDSSVRLAVTDPASAASGRTTPASELVGIERRPGGAAPARIEIRQPVVETPAGPVGGGRYYWYCISPPSHTLPRNDDLYRLC